MSDPLEKVIRPIVEGQIRGFAKEHPSIVAAVNWYKPRADKTTTLVNSLSKRVVLDLLCPLTRERIEAALFEIWESEDSDVALRSASDGDCVGTFSDASPVSTVELVGCGEGDQVGRAADLVAIALQAEIEAGTYRPDWMEVERCAV